MTRETALRRMLAGVKVEHPSVPKFYFIYDKNRDCPIIMCRKKDAVIISETGSYILPERTGWKEYRPEEQCQNQEQSSSSAV